MIALNIDQITICKRNNDIFEVFSGDYKYHYKFNKYTSKTNRVTKDVNDDDINLEHNQKIETIIK